MVNKLRRKFVITAMSALLVILVVLIGVINVANFVEVTNSSDEILKTLADNDGKFPEMNHSQEQGASSHSSQGGMTSDNGTGESMAPPMESSKAASSDSSIPPEPKSEEFARDPFSYTKDIEAPFSTRYFWVRFDDLGEVFEVDTSHIASISESIAKEMAQSIYGSSKSKGYEASYRYYVKQMETGGTLILFKDCSSDLYSAVKLLRNTFLLMIVCLIAMFILVWSMSGHAVSPVVESLEKQKRFITDAGHELKTPIAVISANVDVIELDYGKSEWTGSIKNQIKRMTQLVQNMLTLSRMEEEDVRVVFSDVNLSSVFTEAARSFEAVAERSGKRYNVDIDLGVHINGDKNAMTQLASLLIDNAMKYSSEKGEVNVSLRKGKHIEFEVNNTCDNIPEGNLDRLFDRFYRADTSRNRKSGGYGIGLSVARAIANSHGGSIEAIKEGDNVIRFVVKLPKAKS